MISREVTKEEMIEHLMREKGRTREVATNSVNVMIREGLVDEVRPGVFIGSKKGAQVAKDLLRQGYRG